MATQMTTVVGLTLHPARLVLRMLDEDETVKDLASFSQNYHSHLASSVSSAIVQRYLNHELDAALSQNIHIQAVAIDVLSFTNKQGLAHPLQVRRDDGRLYRTTLMFIESVETSPAILSRTGLCLQPSPIALQRWYSKSDKHDKT